MPSALARRIRSKAYDAQVRGRRRAQAAVQPRGEPVAERIRGEPPGSQDEHPLRIQAIAQGAADGSLDKDRRLAGAGRAGHQDGAGAGRDLDGGELVR